MIVDNSPQGTPEWLQARATVITASNLTKVMSKGRGSAPSKTRMTYMIEKATEVLTGNPIAGMPPTPAMKRGTEMEPDARQFYTMLSGNSVDETGLIYLNELKRIGASVDGLVGDEGLVEIKCPNLNTHVNYLLAGVMPAEYVKQVQGQLWITGRRWCDFLSYNPDSHKMGFMFHVERDEEFIKTISTAVYAFIGELDVLTKKLEQL
jgi:putative phage-type endonuclease